MSLAYFINARTEPIEPGPDRYGCGTAAILYGVPSHEVAHAWASDFVERMLLRDNPEQRITELTVVPIHDQLLTPTGEEPITWPQLAKEAEARSDFHSYPLERGSSMMITPQYSDESSELEEPEAEWIERLKKEIPDPKHWNWDQTSEFHYVVYHSEKAFIVRTFNMLLVSVPYMKRVKGTPDGVYPAHIRSWPGVHEYTAIGETR